MMSRAIGVPVADIIERLRAGDDRRLGNGDVVLDRETLLLAIAGLEQLRTIADLGRSMREGMERTEALETARGSAVDAPRDTSWRARLGRWRPW